MPNLLKKDKRMAIISGLAEGMEPPVLWPELAVRASILQDYRESNEHR